MKVLEITSSHKTIQLTTDELVTLNNCMNEAFELGTEFSIRVGTDKKSALKLFNTINTTVEQMQELSK